MFKTSWNPVANSPLQLFMTLLHYNSERSSDFRVLSLPRLTRRGRPRQENMAILTCRLRWLVILAASLAATAQAQQVAATPDAAFEVASIRPEHFTPGCRGESSPGGVHYVLNCISLREMIALAWKIHPDNIRGGDSQALDTNYELSAVTPGGQPWTQDSIRPMLRQLLTERFHVAVHPGTKEVSGYTLVVAKGGPKLKPAKFAAVQGHQAGQPFSNSIFPGYIRGRSADLNVIASLLSGQVRATVVDHTDISGVFDIDVHFATEDDKESNLPDFFTAVEQQLGLKLQPQKVTVNTLLIDHADSEPTPN
jgi:uncharacterized protein (TIGR03435 family)